MPAGGPTEAHAGADELTRALAAWCPPLCPPACPLWQLSVQDDYVEWVRGERKLTKLAKDREDLGESASHAAHGSTHTPPPPNLC